MSSGNGSGLTPRTIGQVGGVETVTLSLAQMPQHIHNVSASTTGSDGTHVHAITDPTHDHTYPVSTGNTPQPVFSTAGTLFNNIGTTNTTNSSSTGISVGNTGSGHGHTINVSQSSMGSNNAHENMPPFYVLAFIMRIS